MSLQGAITPQEIAKPATAISVNSMTFRFGTESSYAIASISYLNEDGATVANTTVGFTEQELAGWGSDDSVLVEIIKTKLGL